MLGLPGLSMLNRATGAAGATLGVVCAAPATGALRASAPALGGLLWKRRGKMGPEQKRRQRERLAAVDKVIATLADSGVQLKALQRFHASFPTSDEMLPKDKYTHYTRNARGYRKPLNHVRPSALPGLASVLTLLPVRQVDQGRPACEPHRVLSVLLYAFHSAVIDFFREPSRTSGSRKVRQSAWWHAGSRLHLILGKGTFRKGDHCSSCVSGHAAAKDEDALAFAGERPKWLCTAMEETLGGVSSGSRRAAPVKRAAPLRCALVLAMEVPKGTQEGSCKGWPA